jgi:murein DD-endopeptidase MepM/ murein hydrolase activator NlpD
MNRGWTRVSRAVGHAGSDDEQVGAHVVVRAIAAVGHSSRLIVSASIVCVALVLVPAGAVRASDEPTTATTTATTTTTTSSPSTVPSTMPSVPTTPSTIPTIPANPSGERSAPSPDQTAAQAEFETLTDNQRSLLRQLQTAKDTLAIRRLTLVALVREVTTARDHLEEARAAEREARARVAETLVQVQRLEEEIGHLTATAYRNHAGTWALGAIGSIDTHRVGALARAQTYARSDLAVLGERVDSLTALQRRLESQQRSTESARAAAEATAADVDARFAAQKQAFEDAEIVGARAHAAAVRSLGSEASLLAQMLDPRFGADDITAVLAFVQAGRAEPAALDGIFDLPIRGASLSSAYGLRIDPIAGGVGYHPGVDFGADARTPIHSAAAGTVVVAGDCGGYGNCVVIDHGTSLATLYGHQSDLLVKVGDVVTPGQVIGLVGSTGISTGPHLHFEVRLHGAPIDPVPTLAG